MADLRDLYQEVIIDHGRRPRNFGPMPDANRHAEGFNPLCGDRLTLHLELRDGVIADARFEGVGCAISTASASMMTEALKGKTPAQADALFAGFHALVTGVASPAATELGKLTVLAGVREFPARVKCATLAWHTLEAALRDEKRTVSTEQEESL
jgi:nitrogen fixation NifU-like protein